jgi:uncharacterized damage-inducible protein DinB
MEDPRYPVGKFSPKPSITHEERVELIRHIEETPKQLRAAVAGLNEKQLDTPYREGGWTVRQVVHHLPDSHMNAYTRFKLAFTENEPTIKPYNEKAWAELLDNKSAAIEPSLTLMESLHFRWVMFLKSMKPEDFARKLVHPESGLQNLDRMVQLYGWHGRHHVAHITALRKRMGW